uniref:WIYLD domain-containing protein n=1 Tax=Cucumis melo TaxID=3656 RepID=A0A9I9E7M2_CUCME
MKQFGFPPKLVRDTVKELLDVYGGDDGWVFIEEGSYTLLIDTLLEKQNEGAIEVWARDFLTPQSAQTPLLLLVVVKLLAVSTTFAHAYIFPRLNVHLLKVHDNERVDHQCTSVAGCSLSAIDVTPSNEAIITTATLPANELDTLFPGDESYWNNKASVDDDHFRSTFNQSLPAYTPKIRRRKAYHGWIGKDNKEEDLVYLTPDHLPEELAKLLIPGALKKRKKRWDVESAES